MTDETTNDLSTNWERAKTKCEKFRKELRALKIPEDKKITSFLFTKQDLDKLLHKESETPLDGIRAYLGYEEVNGHLLPRLQVVACIKSGDRYIDYVPMNGHGAESARTAIGEPLVDEGRPCPSDCGDPNLLNTP